MKKRRLGNSDLYPSVIALGTWQFAGVGKKAPNSMYGAVDTKQIIKTIHTAIENGINIIDTAPAYGAGRSEEVIGKAIEGTGLRKEIYLATKVGLSFHEGILYKKVAPDNIRYNLENSLRLLKTDYIDLLQIHWPDYNNPIDEAIDCLNQLKKEGKIRTYGVSNFSIKEMEACKKRGHLASLQPPLSILDQEALKEKIPYCVENNIGVFTYAPLHGGLLTGKIKEISEVGARGRFYPYLREGNFEKIQPLIKTLNEIAEGHCVSTAEIAVKWVLSQEGVTSTIIGASRPEQAFENSKMGDGELSQKEIIDIQKSYEKCIQ